MSDPEGPRQKPSPLQAGPVKPRPQQPQRRAGPPSRESQFVGYLVLGLGILAVITVLLLAFSGGNVDTDEQAPDPVVSANLQSGLSKDMPSTTTQTAPAKSELAMKRQKGIDISDLQGGWQASVGPYVAVMQMQNGQFQIMLARPEPEFARLYSAGSYSLLDDLAILKPNRNWQPKAVSGIRYERLSGGVYPMIVGFKNGAMVWQNVPQSEKRIYVPARSPLLLDDSKDYIVWKKIE